MKSNADLLSSTVTEEKLKVAQVVPPQKYVYRNILVHGYWHLAALYGLYLCFTSAHLYSLILAFVLYLAAEVGVTAGAHRLWTHRAYKAKLPLKIMLMLFHSISFQNTVMDWARDHRLHHKYSDTDADPHNPSRGLFYSHIGWVLVRKHPEVKKRGECIDMSDVNNDPVLQFQKKYAVSFIGTVCFFLPTVIPMYFWGESFINAWHINMLRYICNLNATFLVNSIAHRYGYKPYDKKVMPAQNLLVSVLILGEGFHNYHHTFPWDYRTAELGNNWLNVTTKFIDFFAWIGWAYDLKTVREDVILNTARKHGDGTDLWGWGDKDMSKEDANCVELLYKNSNK